MRFKKTTYTLIYFALMALTPTAAMAGSRPGRITFGPGETPFPGPVDIPTMGGIGLILLALVLAAIGIQRMKAGQFSSFVLAGLGAVVLASAGSGVSLISSSMATSDVDVSAPGSFDVNGSELNTYNNSSGTPLIVTEVLLPDDCPTNTPANACVVDGTVEDGNSCIVDCRLPVR